MFVILLKPEDQARLAACNKQLRSVLSEKDNEGKNHLWFRITECYKRTDKYQGETDEVPKLFDGTVVEDKKTLREKTLFGVAYASVNARTMKEDVFLYCINQVEKPSMYGSGAMVGALYAHWKIDLLNRYFPWSDCYVNAIVPIIATDRVDKYEQYIEMRRDGYELIRDYQNTLLYGSIDLANHIRSLLVAGDICICSRMKNYSIYKINCPYAKGKWDQITSEYFKCPLNRDANVHDTK